MHNRVISRILELCEERHLSLYRLSKLSNIPKTTLNNMVSQNKMPTIPTIEKVCKGLDITLAGFFSSETLFPGISEEQQKLLVQWNSLYPEERKSVKVYIKMIEENRKDENNSDDC